jgi:hypothetical protein
MEPRRTICTPTTRRKVRRSARAALAATSVAAVLGATLATTDPAAASSHREAPAIAGSPRLDTTDVYAFLSPDKAGTVTLLANWLPFSEPAGGPNFFTFADGASYDIDIDTNGNAKPDVIYRWEFKTRTKNKGTFLYNTGPVTSLDDRDLNVAQTYTLKKYANGRWTTLARNLVSAPSNVGKASMPDYASLRKAATYKVGDRDVFAGQADDPFFLDLRVFNLLYGGDLSEVGNDTLAGYNVNTVGIRVPVAELGGAKNVVGVWSETYAKGANGTPRRVSRLGNPLVNEVVIPLKDKDRFNASRPQGDAQFLKYVTNPGLPKVVEAVYGIKAPAEPRNDLVQVFLTGVPGLNQPKNVVPGEMLRLNLSPVAGQTPSRLGVVGGDANGFPNGRRLSDDVLDAALQVVEGELVGSPNDLGDGVNANDVAFGTRFPYVALPHSGSGSVNDPAAPGTKAAPAAAVSPLEGGKPDAAVPAASSVAAASGSGSAAAGPVGLTVESVARTAVPVTAAGLALTGALLFVRRRRTIATARAGSAGLPA